MTLEMFATEVRRIIAERTNPDVVGCAGQDEDLKSYLDEGYTPSQAADELLSYAAVDHVED